MKKRSVPEQSGADLLCVLAKKRILPGMGEPAGRQEPWESRENAVFPVSAVRRGRYLPQEKERFRSDAEGRCAWKQLPSGTGSEKMGRPAISMRSASSVLISPNAAAPSRIKEPSCCLWSPLPSDGGTGTRMDAGKRAEMTIPESMKSALPVRAERAPGVISAFRSACKYDAVEERVHARAIHGLWIAV